MLCSGEFNGRSRLRLRLSSEQFDLKNDLPNYLEFFKELRKALGDDAIITVDTSSKPWLDPATGSPSTDLGSFAEYLSWATLMLYDMRFNQGAKAVSGPNFVRRTRTGRRGGLLTLRARADT